VVKVKIVSQMGLSIYEALIEFRNEQTSKNKKSILPKCGPWA
jgi:hypothetical protein